MDRAAKVALKMYPLDKFDGEIGDSMRAACFVGYAQAMYDLTLTWEDVKNLDHLLHDADFENGRAESLGKEILFDGDEGFYGKVLKRFNEQRKKELING